MGSAPCREQSLSARGNERGRGESVHANGRGTSTFGVSHMHSFPFTILGSRYHTIDYKTKSHSQIRKRQSRPGTTRSPTIMGKRLPVVISVAMGIIPRLSGLPPLMLGWRLRRGRMVTRLLWEDTLLRGTLAGRRLFRGRWGW